VLVDTDIGSTVEAYDSTILKSADIGSTVQGYDADTAKYDDATANFTGTLQNNGSDVVVDTDIGSTVQAYDADTAKLDVAQTWTAKQDFDTATATDLAVGSTTVPSGVKAYFYENDSTDALIRIENTDGYMDIGANGNNAYYIAADHYFYVSGTPAIRINTSNNIEILNAGSGIDFSATAGTGTSELLDDYEEGTWTPTIVAGSLTINATSCHYTKIGNVVTAFFNVTFPVQTNANDADLFDLPFTISSTGGSAAAISTDRSTTDPTFGLGFANQVRLRFFSGSAVLTLTGMSGKNVSGSFTYRV